MKMLKIRRYGENPFSNLFSDLNFKHLYKLSIGSIFDIFYTPL